VENSAVNRNTLAAIAPKLAELTETVLFGDIWARRDLSPRERSLITLSALTALGKTQQLPWHIALGYQNGLSQAEIVELFTHLAFYAGWPAAASALTCLNEQERHAPDPHIAWHGLASRGLLNCRRSFMSVWWQSSTCRQQINFSLSNESHFPCSGIE
jgi:4-carboxymuconolactone decarboxylase